MITLKKNQRNIIAVTLNESSRVSSPFYLFLFQSDGAKREDKVIFIAPDTSAHQDRINIFELIEGENGRKTFANGYKSLSAGASHLSLMRGQYTYEVYESSAIVDTVEETTGRIVESGILIVGTTEDEEDKGQNNNELNVYE